VQRVAYSKNKSDIVTKIEGSFDPEEKQARKANKVNEKKRKAEDSSLPSPPHSCIFAPSTKHLL